MHDRSVKIMNVYCSRCPFIFCRLRPHRRAIGVGNVVTKIIALAVGFVPIIGQITVFLIYTYYSALMFVDYPASRRRWGLGKKLQWLRHYSGHSLRLGLIPAAVSMVPLLNVFLLAFIFPLFTVHAALNFSAVEASRSRASR